MINSKCHYIGCFVFSLLMQTGIADAACAQEGEKEVTNSEQPFFDQLKALVGKWKHESKNELVEYVVICRGTALVENWRWPDRDISAMTVYHMDGDQLISTHYCPVGNQPTLVFDGVDEHGFLTFKFQSITNLLDRGESHCIQFRIKPGKERFTRSESYSSRDGVDVSEGKYLKQ